MDTHIERNWAKKGYWGLVQSENFIGHFFLLLIRIYWGGLLVITGLGKLMNTQGVIDFFTSINVPFPTFSAYLVGIVELLGGVSLFTGFFSRIFTLILAILFFTAYATAHTEAFLNIFTNPSLFTKEEPFLFLYASLIVLCFGPGMFSVDYWLEKRTYGEAL